MVSARSIKSLYVFFPLGLLTRLPARGALAKLLKSLILSVLQRAVTLDGFCPRSRNRSLAFTLSWIKDAGGVHTCWGYKELTLTSAPVLKITLLFFFFFQRLGQSCTNPHTFSLAQMFFQPPAPPLSLLSRSGRTLEMIWFHLWKPHVFRIKRIPARRVSFWGRSGGHDVKQDYSVSKQ